MTAPQHDDKREEVYSRQITFKGYRLEGVLWQVEAHLKDVRSADFPCIDRGGFIKAGEPFHEMRLTLTFDDDLVIRDISVSIDSAPFAACPLTQKAFEALKGAKIEKGFYRQARVLLPVKKTCLHLFDLLTGAANAAFQTVAQVRYFKYARGLRPEMIDTCYAWDASGEVVKREWPQYAVSAEKNNGQT